MSDRVIAEEGGEALASTTDTMTVLEPRAPVFVTGGSGYIGRNLLRALVSAGHPVRALARSAASAEVVADLGADPVRGDLADAEALHKGMTGVVYLIHAAADTGHGLETSAQEEANLEGTRRVYEQARRAGVRRALHLSTEAVLLDGRPLRDADETAPYPDRPAGGYSRTKALAERIALDQAREGLEVVVLRPRFVWGRDDTTALPQLVEAARSGKLAWIDGGHYRISTTHIANVVHGVLLALARGGPGEVYFISDGEPVEFREFVTKLLATQGVEPPTREVPRWLVVPLIRIGEALARLTNGVLHGPMTWQEYAVLGVEVTLDIRKARRDLGYEPVITREQGLTELTSTSATSGTFLP